MFVKLMFFLKVVAEDLQGVEFPPTFNHQINKTGYPVTTYIISIHQVVILCSVLILNH